jgi:hypothetical protein
MRNFHGLRSVAAALVGGAFAVGMSGCGILSIESWIKVIEAQSSGSVVINGGASIPLSNVQGGFLGLISVDTRALPGPLSGTVAVEDVRLGTKAGIPIGKVCVWGNPAGTSSGTVTLDLLAGTGSANLNLDLLATTLFSSFLPPVNLKQPVSLNLSGVSLSSFLAAQASGSADGLFATTTSFSGTSTILGLPVTFALNLAVTNGSTPPLFDADTEGFCGPFFAQQFPPTGTEPGLFYGINSKSSYLTAAAGDNPQPPLVIALSDLGAVPGKTLHLTRIGTFADSSQLKNGGQTKVSGVFSSTNVVLGTDVQNRIPGAVASAAPAFVTPPVFQGFFRIVPTDIPDDFLIDPGIDVVVPNGAAYLIVAPFAPDLSWGDNSGFSLGVAIEVN